MKSVSHFLRNRAWGVLVLVLLLLHSLPALSAGTAPTQTYATTPDGVRIAIQEYGNPDGPEIVLIHGLGGSHLDWMKQVDSSFLRKYRLITYDLRGHGLSAKPTQPEYYSDGKRWGDELHAVIEAARLKKPLLVGWSLGGVVITNYLGTYGDSNVAGVVYVAGVIELKPGLVTPPTETLASLNSPDLAVYLEGARQFIRLCFYHQPDPETFALLYANATTASREMFQHVSKGISVPAATALPKVKAPVAFVYGERDALVDARTVELAKQLVPGMKAMIYGETGHAPFLEQPDRFNQDLDVFAQQAGTLASAK